MSIEQPQQVWGDHSQSCLFNSYIQRMGLLHNAVAGESDFLCHCHLFSCPHGVLDKCAACR